MLWNCSFTEDKNEHKNTYEVNFSIKNKKKDISVVFKQRLYNQTGVVDREQTLSLFAKKIWTSQHSI